MRTADGFTLVELLIALALGSMIIIAAAAGVRVASQAVTVSTRLSRENALMRAGVARAHDEVDFWTTYDDPLLPDARRALKNVAGTIGLPFQPFTASYPKSGTWPTVSEVDALTDGDESAIGWDGSYAAFATANPRSWLRANLVEKDVSDLRFGRYAIFANIADTLAQSGFYPIQPPTPRGGAAPPPITYGPATPPRHWYYRQVQGLTKALGYYGLLEYLPASALYEFYQPHDRTTNEGGIPMWCIAPGGNFNNWEGGQQTARGKYRNSYATSYALVDPLSPAITNANQGTLASEHRRWWALGYGADANAQADFNRKTAVPYDLLALHPVAWPDLTVSVQRFVKNARHAQVCRVRWTSPITGESAELSFASFGTSLRGARQQRRPDSGWARWDDDGADHSTDPAFKTLDSY